MKPEYLFLILLLTPFGSAGADEFWTKVGYECLQKEGKLVVHYKGAYDWKLREEPWPDGISSVDFPKSYPQASCKLRKKTYVLEFRYFAESGTGRCGAATATGVGIRRGKKEILPFRTFEPSDCLSSDPILIRIELLESDERLVLTQVSQNEFYSLDD